ncbi:AraC family transcriptional regulator [Pseudomonas sp. 14P_8.1_Bac3]|uniref:AraC family transcriptional regulator n=1 Tax=Pseudomonas sp. 14P_8.1_Bac3 TaxID=2971621 RepID=UPI0021C7F0AB|nr:AraC family transcriptional regulator [Pseudomonas sp. 14P_8.1_Bac3]MCU1758801.1 AraC family transcriptional regulator [Pseudomonas sp. 14P_8.1_Bac3]
MAIKDTPPHLEQINPLRTQPRTVIFVAYPQMGLLDLTGAQTVFWAATRMLSQLELPGYNLHTVSLIGGAVRTGEGLVVQTQGLDEIALDPIDTLIVPGSPHIRQALVDNIALIDWLRAFSTTADRTTSICSGAFFLASAGLLDGLRVATHWTMADYFEQLFPHVQLDREAIFVQQKSIWTAAGVSAGIDLALALVEADNGREVAMQVARHLLLYYRRPDNQELWSPLLKSQYSSGV